MSKITKKDKEQALAEWRKEHFAQMDINLEQAMAIRDRRAIKKVKCPHCKKEHEISIQATGDKEVLSAIKEINLMLGSRSPEKVAQATAKATAQQAQVNIKKPPLRPEIQDMVNKLKGSHEME